ncbi:MAG TPA: glycosyl hydrolase [Solirubrobacterales bacterium]
MRARGALAAAVAGLALLLPAAAPSAAPSPPTADFYGVTSATEMEPSEYARMGGGGVRTLRVPLFWPFIEPKAPQPQPSVPGLPVGLPEDRTRWGPTDQIVERAASHGIRLLPFVYGSPDWVAGGNFERPPIDDAAARAAWQDFLGDLVGRYGPGGEFWEELALREPAIQPLPIGEWQIWNEANSPVFWHPRPAPAEYRELVTLAAEAIRAADPGATIVLGGMFGSPTRGIRAWDFLDRFLAGGEVAASFDAYALHPYAPDLDGIAAQVRRLRRVIDAGPDPAAPLWITEIGWPTDGPKSFALVKSERGQKRLLARSFRLFLSTAEWNVAKVVWYVWRDNDVQAGCHLCRYAGLFTHEFEAKPAWRKLTQFTGGRP